MVGRYEIRSATRARPIAASANERSSPPATGGRSKPSVSSDDPLTRIASPVSTPIAQNIAAKQAARMMSHQTGRRTRAIGP
jgi:hypothetical protein